MGMRAENETEPANDVGRTFSMRTETEFRPANDVGEPISMRFERETRPDSDVEESVALWGRLIVAFAVLMILVTGLDLGRAFVLTVAGAPMCALVTVLIQAVKKASGTRS
jgi:hypothetical protein